LFSAASARSLASWLESFFRMPESGAAASSAQTFCRRKRAANLFGFGDFVSRENDCPGPPKFALF